MDDNKIESFINSLYGEITDGDTLQLKLIHHDSASYTFQRRQDGHKIKIKRKFIDDELQVNLINQLKNDWIPPE